MKKSKINSLIKFDASFYSKSVIGTDEAGRGPGAGMVYAAAVHFPEITKKLKKDLAYLDDSKKLSAKIREELCEIVKIHGIYAFATSSTEEIEMLNILQASLLAMKRASMQVLEQIRDAEPILLIDGNKTIKTCEIPQKAVIKGDSLSLSIAAASIIAKVERDNYMIELSKKYPEYDWQNNKGYLTPSHLEAIEKYVITPHHRKSFLTKQLTESQVFQAHSSTI